MTNEAAVRAAAEWLMSSLGFDIYHDPDDARCVCPDCIAQGCVNAAEPHIRAEYGCDVCAGTGRVSPEVCACRGTNDIRETLVAVREDWVRWRRRAEKAEQELTDLRERWANWDDLYEQLQVEVTRHNNVKRELADLRAWLRELADAIQYDEQASGSWLAERLRERIDG